MKTFRIRIGGKESVVICRKHVFQDLAKRMGGAFSGIVLTDSNVFSLYQKQIKRYLGGVPFYVMPAGEEHKNEETLFGLLRAMAEAGLRRDSVLIALGGGVVGDVGGLAASLYMRGISCIQVPTTLLAQTDSAVGGKTAIDFCGVKNLVGSFHQPALVLADPAFFATLPAREITCGLGEIVKYGALDGALFDRLCAQSDLRDPAFLEEIVPVCISLKAAIVKKDPEERGLRRCLNLGHTTAHAAELGEAGLSHGACVLAGMLCEARLAAKFCETDGAYLARLESLIRRAADFDLRAAVPSCANRALSDKKNASDGEVTLVVPVQKGEWRILALPFATYEAELAAIGSAL